MNNKNISDLICTLEEKYRQKPQYVTLSSVAKTDIETNILLNNPYVFYFASNARVILVHWICEEIRKIFEENEYAPLNIKRQVHEELRNRFKTRAFNRISLDNLFHGSKVCLTYDEYVLLEEKYINEYNKVAPADLRIFIPSREKILSVQRRRGEINIQEDLEKLIKKFKDILILRSNGMKLEEIGNKWNVTRERIRQIELAPSLDIDMWMTQHKKDVLSACHAKNILQPKKAIEVFGEQLWDIVLYYTDNNRDRFVGEWHKFAEIGTIYCGDKDIRTDVCNIIEYACNKNMHIDNIMEQLNEAGYDEFTNDMIIRLCDLKGYRFYKGRLHRSKINLGNAIIISVETEFPDGIILTDEEQMKRLIAYIKENYEIQVQLNRAFKTRIQNVLVMVGKDHYCAKSCINENIALGNKICDIIKQYGGAKVSYKQILSKIPKDLLEKNKIYDELGIHGYIKINEEKLGLHPMRYYVSAKETDKFPDKIKSKFFFQPLVDLLFEKGSMTTKEIVDHFDGWTEMYPKYALLYYPQLSQWKKDCYINLDSIQITEDVKKAAEECIMDGMQNNLRYTNSYIVEKKLREKNPEFFEKNNIENELQLFHILRYLFRDDERWVFCRPHIVPKEYGINDFSMEDLILLVIGNREFISKKEVIEEVIHYYGCKNSSIFLTAISVLKDFVRVESDKYYKKNSFVFSDAEINAVRQFIKENLDRKSTRLNSSH